MMLLRRDLQDVLSALPTTESIQVDPSLLIAQNYDPGRLAYALFDGYANRAPGAALAIGFDPDNLPRERWHWEKPCQPARNSTLISVALRRARRRIGHTEIEAFARLVTELGLKFDGTQRGLDAPDGFPAACDKVADAIAHCLAHAVAAKPAPGITPIRYGRPSGAECAARMHQPARYRSFHDGRELRISA